MTTYRFDPELAPVVAALPTVDVSNIAAARAGAASLAEPASEVDVSGVDVSDLTVPGPAGAPDVPVRVYRPTGAAATATAGVAPALAAVLDIHGGGFMVGDLEIDHAHNVALARALGALVVSVDYRLAPEYRFPAGLEDCYAALTWLATKAADLGVDPARIAVHGASAGGGLAAGLALLARDRGGPGLCFQFLGVPELDDRLETPSMRAFTDTPLWNRPNAIVSWNAYLGRGVPGTDGVSPYAAPARATDLAGLPPAYISVMEFDPLRDEGIAYALALLAAGVSVELHLFPGTFHGSTTIAKGAAVSRREIAEVAAVLVAALRP